MLTSRKVTYLNSVVMPDEAESSSSDEADSDDDADDADGEDAA